MYLTHYWFVENQKKTKKTKKQKKKKNPKQNKTKKFDGIQLMCVTPVNYVKTTL